MSLNSDKDCFLYSVLNQNLTVITHSITVFRLVVKDWSKMLEHDFNLNVSNDVFNSTLSPQLVLLLLLRWSTLLVNTSKNPKFGLCEVSQKIKNTKRMSTMFWTVGTVFACKTLDLAAAANYFGRLLPLNTSKQIHYWQLGSVTSAAMCSAAKFQAAPKLYNFGSAAAPEI